MNEIGKISIQRNGELGNGYRGTIVKGYFENRQVAVKILPKNYYKIFKRQSIILQDVDSHPNVVRYFCSEQDINYYYIALAFCSCTLKDFVTKGFKFDVEIKEKQIFYETALGLSHLHKLSIIHRDIKPQNILFCIRDKVIVTKLSDFGFAKDLSNDSQSTIDSIYVVDKWMAPEISNHHQANKQTDVYSLGCVYNYTLKKELNSMNDSEKILAKALILMMTNNAPSKRISAHNVTLNPLYWDAEKILNFITDISNRFEKKDSLSNKMRDEMNIHQTEICVNWLENIDSVLVSNLKQRRRYDGNSIEDLIRAIRNKRAHYEETPTEIKEIFVKLPDEFLNYWTIRFPKLLQALYEIANKFLLNESTFSTYVSNKNETTSTQL